jgi:energy-coupling factor transporter ATP-binding protein EcfA2
VPDLPPKGVLVIPPYEGPDKKNGATKKPPGPTPVEVSLEPEHIPFVGMAEALAMPETPVKWVVDGLINEGAMSMLVGPFKGGKSTLLRILCACVATGHPFLGREVQQGRVGYCGLEERFDDLMRHFRTLFVGSDEATQNLAMVSAGDDWVPDRLEDRFDVIEASIEKHQLKLLVIGPIHDLIQFNNTNDYAEVKSKVRGLKKVCERAGCAIASDHHMNKYGIGRNALLGSVAFGAVSDQVFYLPYDKENSVRAFFSDQRVGISIDEPLGITYGREGIDSDLGPPPERVRNAMAEQALMEQVIGCCAEGRKDLDTIIDQIKERRAKVLAAVQRAVREGYLDVEGKGVRNNPMTYLATSVAPRHPDNIIRFPQTPEPIGTESLPEKGHQTCHHRKPRRGYEMA